MRFNLQRGAVRTFYVLAVSGVLSILLLLIWDTDAGYMYRKHLMSKSHLVMDFKDLNANMTHQEIKGRYPINWYCKPEHTLVDFGDLMCADELSTWNGMGAFHIMLWYKKGRLNVAKIRVPFWHHKNLISHLNHTYGEPENIGDSLSKVKSIKNLVRWLSLKVGYLSGEWVLKDEYAAWRLPNRTRLTANLEGDSDPFSQNMVLWRSEDYSETLKRNYFNKHADVYQKLMEMQREDADEVEVFTSGIAYQSEGVNKKLSAERISEYKALMKGMKIGYFSYKNKQLIFGKGIGETEHYRILYTEVPPAKFFNRFSECVQTEPPTERCYVLLKKDWYMTTRWGRLQRQ